VLASPSFAQAQAAQNTVAAGMSVMEFDLTGVGTAPGMTLRASRALTDHIAIEGSFPMSWLSEDFGKSKLFAPEVQLQYHWQAGRFRPYVGGGAGIAWRDRGVFGNSDVNLTLSAAGGTRFDVTSRVALLGEVRLRGIERDFAGSTADVMGGISYRW
jgi:outer membrane protein W